MKTYRHYVSGFFAHRDEAEKVVSKLFAAGLPLIRVHLFDKEALPPTHAATESSDLVLKDIMVDGAIGTAVGTGVGALLTIGAVAANFTLFIASPLIAPLAMLGWGASIGGLVGASVGAAEKAKPLSDLIHDAIISGSLVVMVETISAEETQIAGKIFKEAVGDYTDSMNPEL
jgi:hypothetical protein